jgi:hypothetical protein
MASGIAAAHDRGAEAVATTAGPSGTVAARQPLPRPAKEADSLVREGVARAEAAERLAGSWPADELRAAQLWWVQRMPKRSWDDHHPSAVLRVLEAALAIAEPLLADDQD